MHTVYESNSSIWPIDRTQSGGSGSNGNVGVFCIPQSLNITTDGLVSYPVHLLGESYSSTVRVFSTPCWLGWESEEKEIIYISMRVLSIFLNCHRFIAITPRSTLTLDRKYLLGSQNGSNGSWNTDIITKHCLCV